MVRKNQKNSSNISMELALMPEAAALTAVRELQYRSTPIGILDLYTQIQNEAKEIENGNLVQIEKYLFSQAIALNAIFDHMLSRLADAEFPSVVQLTATLALKAQAQCRVTLATLAEIKNPARTTFIQQSIRQQNNAINQQVNNTCVTDTVRNTENFANELLETQHEKRLDSSTASQTIRDNPKLETLETVNRAKINRG